MMSISAEQTASSIVSIQLFLPDDFAQDALLEERLHCIMEELKFDGK